TAPRSSTCRTKSRGGRWNPSCDAATVASGCGSRGAASLRARLAPSSAASDDVPMDAAVRQRTVERIKRALRDRSEVLEAYLFGSQARGDVHAESDVDVAVYVDCSRADDSAFGIAAELSTILASATGQDQVDIVLLNDAPPLLYHRILRDGIRLLS